jgi:hypothetical protein
LSSFEVEVEQEAAKGKLVSTLIFYRQCTPKSPIRLAMSSVVSSLQTQLRVLALFMVVKRSRTNLHGPMLRQCPASLTHRFYLGFESV